MSYNYSSWSVTFGEQPTAAKWNIIGTNMASFDERIGANFSASTTSTIWWEEIGRTTLGSAGDTISVTPIAARTYLKILFIALDTGGTISALIRFNNDSAANYAIRVSTNGGADVTAASETSLTFTPSTAAVPVLGEAQVVNITASEKLVTGNTVSRGAAGAANTPSRREVSGKWANTAAQITRVDLVNSGTGDFAIGSAVVVLGHD